MFIDISTYVGRWPFGNVPYNTLEGLDELAQRYDITHMVVANIQGFFYKDANESNLELLQWLKEYKGKTKFLPLAVVDPSYSAWEKDARNMIAAGFVGFELAPLYHGYTMEPSNVFDHAVPMQYGKPVLALAEELDVPVRICACIEDPRGRAPMDRRGLISGDEYYSLLSTNQNAHVFVTSFAPSAAGDRFGALLKTRKNTYFDLDRYEVFGTDRCKPILNVVTNDQICFGSLSPFNYMECSLVRCAYGEGLDFEAIKTNPARAFKALR